MANIPLDPSQERRFEEVLAAYLQAAEAGQAPDHQELIARHPDLAPALESFFGNHQQFRQLARMVPPGVTPGATEDRVEPAPANTVPDRSARATAETVSGPATPGLPRLFGDYELLEEIARG